MTKEQAEKLKQERRKKRLRKKRIKAFTTLIIIIILFCAIVFFAIKAVMHFVNKDPSSSLASTDSVQVVNENKNDVEITPEGETKPEEDSKPAEGTAVENNSESQTPPPTQPVGEKPEQSWSTVLVNVDHPMSKDYTMEVRDILDTGKKFDVRAADNLEAMLNDAKKAGYNMFLVSSYRSLSYQEGLYSRKVNEYKKLGYDEETAKAEAAKWVAIPGTSEHALALAADIVSSTWYNTNSDLTEEFENTEHFKWLYEHCADYGFILRYPKGRESTTHISYEPWHYRYVGVDAAKYIMANNITLEEFCGV